MQKTCTPATPDVRRSAKKAVRSRAGLTLVEVMIAFSVLILSICGALITLQFSLKSLDTARCGTLAGQLMQSQVESLRLKSWADITTQTAKTFTKTELAAMVPADAAAIVDRFTMSQTVTTEAGRNVRTFSITVTWTATTGATHTRTTTMRYAQNGLYDYYVTTS